jgi:hypothetical protein
MITSALGARTGDAFGVVYGYVKPKLLRPKTPEHKVELILAGDNHLPFSLQLSVN